MNVFSPSLILRYTLLLLLLSSICVADGLPNLLIPPHEPIQIQNFSYLTSYNDHWEFAERLREDFEFQTTLFENPYNRIQFRSFPNELAFLFYKQIPGDFHPSLSPVAHNLTRSLMRHTLVGSQIVAYRYFTSPLTEEDQTVLAKRQKIFHFFLTHPQYLKRFLKDIDNFKKHENYLIFLFLAYQGHELSYSVLNDILWSHSSNKQVPRDFQYIEKADKLEIFDLFFRFVYSFSLYNTRWGGLINFCTSSIIPYTEKFLSWAFRINKTFGHHLNKIDTRYLAFLTHLLGRYYWGEPNEKDLTSLLHALYSMFGFFLSHSELSPYFRTNVSSLLTQMRQHSLFFQNMLHKSKIDRNLFAQFFGKEAPFSALIDILDLPSPNLALQELYLDLSEFNFLARLAHIFLFYQKPYSRIHEFSTDQFQIENFWNLVLFHQSDLTLQSYQSPGLTVLNAPNASGKTTYANSILSVVLMAHSVGFVPAESAQIPFFRWFFVNRPADSRFSQNGLSQFAQEMRQLQELFLLFQKKSPQQRVFVLLDEPFVQTRPFYAGLLDIYVASFLSQNPLAHSLLISHHVEILHLQHPRIQKGKMAFTLQLDENGMPVFVKNHYIFQLLNEEENHSYFYPQTFIEKGFLLEIESKIPELSSWFKHLVSLNNLEIR